MNFGRRVELARKELGLTRASLSARVGISEGSLRDLEILNSTPRRMQEVLPKLAAELGASINFLITGTLNKSTALVANEIEKIEQSCSKIKRQF